MCVTERAAERERKRGWMGDRSRDRKRECLRQRKGRMREAETGKESI